MPKDSSMTPLPTADLMSLTTAVARIDQNVRSIKSDMLPPLMKDTREARDKAREALQKANDHIADLDSHEHPCIEGPRQERQDSELQKNRGVKDGLSNLSKLFWVAISIITTIVAGSYGYTLLISNTTTENKTVNGAQGETLVRHETNIDALRKAQQQDRETYLRGQQEIPQRVINAMKSTRPTVEEIEDAAGEIPGLTEPEQRQLLKILKRAKQRDKNDMKTVTYDR